MYGVHGVPVVMSIKGMVLLYLCSFSLLTVVVLLWVFLVGRPVLPYTTCTRLYSPSLAPLPTTKSKENLRPCLISASTVDIGIVPFILQ